MLFLRLLLSFRIYGAILKAAILLLLLLRRLLLRLGRLRLRFPQKKG